MNRSIKTVLILLVTVSLAGCLLLTAVQLAAFDISFYKRAYDKFNLYKTTGLTKRNYISLCENILVYLNGQMDFLYNRSVVFGSEKYLFSQRELLHMQDVKDLFVQGYRVRNLSFALLIGLIYAAIRLSKGSKHFAGKALLWGSAVLFTLAVALGLLLQTDFYRHFTIFHEVFFSNDLWLLNPETDLLINMFPLEFFNDMAIRIMMYFGAGLAGIASVGYFLAKTEKPTP
jgi:integral membrane protein (TIGR01906 family)